MAPPGALRMTVEAGGVGVAALFARSPCPRPPARLPSWLSPSLRPLEDRRPLARAGVVLLSARIPNVRRQLKPRSGTGGGGTDAGNRASNRGGIRGDARAAGERAVLEGVGHRRDDDDDDDGAGRALRGAGTCAGPDDGVRGHGPAATIRHGSGARRGSRPRRDAQGEQIGPDSRAQDGRRNGHFLPRGCSWSRQSEIPTRQERDRPGLAAPGCVAG